MAMKVTESSLQRLIRKRRGQGFGVYYKPFITVQAISSNGRSRRWPGVKIQRIFHLLSDTEFRFLLLLEWDERVIDIREQFPLLDRDETMAIAKAMGVRHPYYPRTSVPVVLTVDFLVTYKIGTITKHVAYDAKLWSHVGRPRTLAKLEIARRYLAARNVEHHVVLDRQINRQLVRNIEWVRTAEYAALERLPYRSFVTDTAYRLQEFLARTISFDERPINQVCLNFDRECRLDSGTGLRFARILLNRRILTTDMNATDLEMRPLWMFDLNLGAAVARAA